MIWAARMGIWHRPCSLILTKGVTVIILMHYCSTKIRRKNMNRQNSIKTILIIAIIFILGFSGRAFADPGMGYGRHHGWGYPMHERHHGVYGGPGFGYRGELSEEDASKLDQERLNFFEATKDLRSKLYQKGLELRSELAKEDPDVNRAAALQKEISELKAELGQKRLTHFFNLRKIIPDIGRSPRGGYGMMGPGMMHGGMMGPGMMGPGGYGSRYYPDCPYDSPRGGYGMGPGMMHGGMMGPGMMGPGWGWGMNPYDADRDDPQQSVRPMGPLERKDAERIVESYIQATGNPNLKLGKIEDSGNAFKAQIVTKENSLVEEVLIDKDSGYLRPAY
jgi:hypothetical protein